MLSLAEHPARPDSAAKGDDLEETERVFRGILIGLALAIPLWVLIAVAGYFSRGVW